MSNDSDFQRALDEGESASTSAKRSAARSPQSFISFVRDILDLSEVAFKIAGYVQRNWSSVQSTIRNFFGI